MKFCLTVTCLLALATSSKADGLDGLVYAPGHSSVDYYAYPSYAFEYAVKDPHTGDNKAQWEKRDGDTVKGAYSLVEPDGSLRVVEYWADAKSGFNAVVKRVGPNLHPVAAPIYKAPIPVLSQQAVVGSLAKIEALGNVPLTGSAGYGGAVSSAAVYKAMPIVKSVAPIASYLPAPIYKAPILPKPIITEPYIKAPTRGPFIREPFIKEFTFPAEVKTSSLLEPTGLISPWPLWKDSPYLSPLSALGDGLLKGSLLSGYGADLGYNPGLPLWDSFGLGLKY